MENLTERLSMGFKGYRYNPVTAHLARPIVPDGNPTQIIGGENLYHDTMTLRTFPGLSKLFAAQLGETGKRRVTGVFPHITIDGTVYFVLCTGSKIYCYAPGDASPTDITPTVAPASTDTDYWSGAFWADKTTGYVTWLLLTNGIDAPYYWDGNPANKVAALAGSPPAGKHFCTFGQHVFLSNVKSGSTYYKQRDYRSNVDDATDWSGGSAGSNDLRQNPGDILGSITFGDVRYIVKGQSMVRCRGTGSDPPFTYDQDELPIGTAAARTIIKCWKYDVGFLLGHDLNVYLLRRDGGIVPIGDDITHRIREWPNKTNLKHAFAMYYPVSDQVMLAVPSSNLSTYCDKILCFDLGWYVATGESIWSAPVDIGLSFSAGNVGPFRSYYNLEQLEVMYGTIGNLPGTIGSLFQDSAYSEVVLGDKDGYVYKLDPSLETANGVLIPWEFETSDLKLAGKFAERFRLQEYTMMFRRDGVSANVYISTDGGYSYCSPQAIDMAEGTGADEEEIDGTAWFDINAKKYRMKVTGSGRCTLVGQRWFGTQEGRF